LCLNGIWEFEIDKDGNRSRPGRKPLSHRIVVPFCPESELSGIANTDIMECVWYRRDFTAPRRWVDGRVLPHFGAVDYEATCAMFGFRGR